MKKIFICFISLFAFLILLLYSAFLFVLPNVFNNTNVIRKLETLIENKFQIQTKTDNLKLKTTPSLDIYLNIKNIEIKKSDKKILNIQNLTTKFDAKKRKIAFLKSESIFIDGNEIKKIKFKTKKNKKTKFEIKKLPEISVDKLEYKSSDFLLNASNIKLQKEKIKLNADIVTPFVKETIKIGDLGNLYVNNDKISADNFEVKLNNSKVYLDGVLIDKNKTKDFVLKGENIPVNELMAVLLYYQKSQDPAKKFIENFKNYTGVVNVNLKFNNDGVWGKCIVDDLSAKAVWFNIPLNFKQAVFNFNGKNVTSVATGKLAGEKVIHTLNITNLGEDRKEVFGSLNTTLTKKFNYVPRFFVQNTIEAGLIYKIKSKKVDVFYNFDINPDNDLIYDKSYLGLKNYKRKIYAHTLKNSNDLYLKDFSYSYYKDNKENKIISGDGLFVKINDKYTPQYISCHTNGYAPVSVAGSFGEKIKGGEFSGDLRYDFIKNKITGTFDIINAKYKDFIVAKALVEAKNNDINIVSNGTFKNEKYQAKISGKNDYSNGVLIYNMKLLLDKLEIETESDKPKRPKKPIKIDAEKISKKTQDTDITINNWEVIINEIKREKFILKNVKLIGSMKNDIFKFNMNELDFANGILKAKGIYNFKNNSSEMTFEAKNINSSLVANMLLNLQNQVEGTANATVNIKAFKMFKFINANCNFEINEGFLPKIGNTEFMVKNSKYKISQITNLDLTQKNLLKSNIKGSFDVKNTKLKNVDITSSQDFLALFLEGEYEIKKQYANLHLFGKYNKEAPKGVKIFFVPLNWILNVAIRPENSMETYKAKLSKIPKINTEDKNTKYFRVQLNGNINTDKADIIIKGIR